MNIDGHQWWARDVSGSPTRSVARLQRLHAVVQQDFDVCEVIAEVVHSLTERIARFLTQEDRLILGRAARVGAYKDPSLEDSAQVWIPALSLRDELVGATGIESVSDSDGTDDCICTCDFCQGYRAALALHVGKPTD